MRGKNILKKLTVLLMICSLFVITTMVFAEEKPGMKDDGISSATWTSSTTNDYVNDTKISRAYFADADVAGQEASVKLNAKAYIPCYLKLEFTGNQGKTLIESFGPNAKGDVTPTTYEMVFDNEMGGFVDGAWNVIKTGKNAEVAPDANTYIAACDTFKVVVFSNDNFKYDVISAPLTGKGNLNLIMGTSNTLTGTYSNDTFNTAKTVNFGPYDPCTTVTKFHKFAVPYTTSTVQGAYSGNVTFKAYTI
jgi:hypothetical protein